MSGVSGGVEVVTISVLDVLLLSYIFVLCDTEELTHSLVPVTPLKGPTVSKDTNVRNV